MEEMTGKINIILKIKKKLFWYILPQIQKVFKTDTFLSSIFDNILDLDWDTNICINLFSHSTAINLCTFMCLQLQGLNNGA